MEGSGLLVIHCRGSGEKPRIKREDALDRAVGNDGMDTPGQELPFVRACAGVQGASAGAAEVVAGWG